MRARQTEAGSGESERLKQIKELLLDDEREEIELLRRRLGEYEEGSLDRLGRNLPEALHRIGGDHPEDLERLSEALRRGTEGAIARSIIEDKSVMARALFPVMGPAIRDYVTDLFRHLAEDLNETIRNTTSVERLRWRAEARLAGKPFSEYLLLKTANYRVERILLIDRESGILLSQVGADGNGDETRDSDLMSGMLTAIRSFVRDSLADPEDPDADNELDRFTYGSHQVLIEGGPDMILAAVVDGVPPFAVKEKLSEALEEIHQLDREGGASGGTGAGGGNGDPSSAGEGTPQEEAMRSALLENRPEGSAAPGGGMWRFWVLCGVLAAGILVWAAWSHHRTKRWEEFVAALERQPGIEVISARKWQRVKGLRDPLAEPIETLATARGVDAEKLDFAFEAYQSLDPLLVEKRDEEAALRELRAEMEAFRAAQLREAEETAAREDALLARIESAETVLAEERFAREQERRSTLRDLLRSRFGHLDTVEWEWSGDTLTVSGRAPSPEFRQIQDQLAAFSADMDVDLSGLSNAGDTALGAAIRELENMRWEYIDAVVEPKDPEGMIAALSASIRAVKEEASRSGRRFRFVLVGYPLLGANSEANRAVVEARIRLVLDGLLEKGVDVADVGSRLSDDRGKSMLGLSVEAVEISGSSEASELENRE